MTDAIEIWIPCQPPKTTYQSGSRIFKRKDGTAFMGKNERGEELQETLLSLLRTDAPKSPLCGPVALRVKYAYPWRKSEPKHRLARFWAWCDKRPDADNIAKALLDCMTRLNYWGDDGQVASLIIEKIWSAEPGIAICVSEIGEGGVDL